MSGEEAGATALPPRDAARAVAAACASHRSWSAARARAGGGEVRERAGGVLAYAPDDERGGWMNVLFVGPGGRTVADEAWEWIRGLPPLRTVGWWAAEPGANGSLAAELLARGFQWGWRPHWMALDLPGPGAAFAFPEGVGLAVFAREDGTGPGASSAPFPAHVRAFGARHEALVALDPPSTVVFAAFDPDDVVGSVTLHARVGVAGIYDCWVLARARRRGIGSALTAAAARRAAAMGCGLAVLNATPMGTPMYRRVGFRSAGWGQTWWLVDRQLRAAAPPDPGEVRFVEAVGTGDLAALDLAAAALAARPGGLDLDAQLPCGETPLGVAVALGQGSAARRLVVRGALLDVVSAWDLGWRDEAARLLRARPELADRRAGEGGPTPLMTAAERGDAALARLLLSAAPDLTLRDGEWGADALGWAEHFGRTEIAAWIRAAAGTSAGGAR